MAKPPERFTITDPHKLFMSCESFRFTTELLKSKIDDGTLVYVFAYITTDAFTCELLLKCIDAARSGTHIRGHKLIELFDVLPKQDQDEIERQWGAQSVGTPNHLPLRDLLTQISSLFEMVRYWHDGKLTPSKCNLIHLVTALRNTLLSIRPDWTPKVNLAKSIAVPNERLKVAAWTGSTLPGGIHLQLPSNLFPPNPQASQAPK